MSHRLVVSAQAEADLRKAFLWYEQRVPGLGLAFLDCVEAKLRLVTESPDVFRKRVGAYRLAMPRRFPYAIYFIWDEPTGIVAVRRVLHFKQERKL